MSTKDGKEKTFFDESFKEHPIISFVCVFVIGVVVFVLIYLILSALLRIDAIDAGLKRGWLTDFIGALLTSIVALAGAVVTVVLARLGLKLGESAQENAVSLHALEYRAKANREVIPAVNAVYALGDAIIAFIGAGRPLRVAMMRHMQIRALSEGTQAGPVDPVGFASYQFDRAASASDLGYFVDKARQLKEAIDEVMRHQIALAAMQQGKFQPDMLLTTRLQSVARARMVTGGDDPLNKLHFIRDYLENNLRAAPRDERLGWGVLAAESVGALADASREVQAGSFSRNLAFAGWLLARYPADGPDDETKQSLNLGYAELLDLLLMLPKKESIISAAANAYSGHDEYRRIVVEVAETVPMLPRELHAPMVSTAVSRLLEVAPRVTQPLAIGREEAVACLEALTSRENVAGLVNELMKAQEVGVLEMRFAVKVEDYDLWLHGARMRHEALPPTFQWMNDDEVVSALNELLEDIQMFFRAYGRSRIADVAVLRAMAGVALSLGAEAKRRGGSLGGFFQSIAMICCHARLRREGGLSVQGEAMMRERIEQRVSEETDSERKAMLHELSALAETVPCKRTSASA